MKFTLIACLCSFTIALTTPSLRAGGNDSVFLLPFFQGNGEAGVYLAYSSDGLAFALLNQGKVVLPAPAPAWPGENLTQDPSIVYHDKMFHMVWTTSWSSRSVGYARSRDLLHWESVRKVVVWQEGVAVRNTWAPPSGTGTRREKRS